MVCKFAIYEEGTIKKHIFESYEEAKKWVDEQIETFKKVNRVENENTDQSFVRFRDGLNDLLDKQSQEDKQENIRLAKQKRDNGESAWKSNLK